MPKSYGDLLREARASIREVTPQEVEAVPDGKVALIDVREASEWEQGHLPGAVHISKSYVEQQIEAAVPDRDAEVILYCAGGVRSLFAAQTLEQMGYTLLAVPLAAKPVRLVAQRRDAPGLIAALVATARLQLVTCALLAAGLWVS
jgi:rhodanese-related sulfurtransferase